MSGVSKAFFLKVWIQSSKCMQYQVLVPIMVLNSLRYETVSENVHKGLPICFLYQQQLKTDARLMGRGTHLGHRIAQGNWNSNEKNQTINLLEHRAIKLAIWRFQSYHKGPGHFGPVRQLYHCGISQQSRRTQSSSSHVEPIENPTVSVSETRHLSSRYYPLSKTQPSPTNSMAIERKVLIAKMIGTVLFSRWYLMLKASNWSRFSSRCQENNKHSGIPAILDFLQDGVDKELHPSTTALQVSATSGIFTCKIFWFLGRGSSNFQFAQSNQTG